MSNEFQEPEEKDLDKNNAEIIDDFNPLDEPVLEKEYTKHNVKVNPNDFTNPIPEPSFTPPPMTGMMTEEEKVNKPKEPYNPEMRDLPKKDKNDAAEKVAEMIMGGYKMLNNFADGRLQINERKLMKMQKAGEIDLNVSIPISPTVSMTSIEFVQEFNEQTKGTITVSKEFEEETMPVLTRVLAKRGIGMTDEQYLAYLFGKDAIQKVFLMNQALGVQKEILNQLKEATQAIRASGGFNVAPDMTNPTPSYTPSPKEPTPPPTPEYEEEPVEMTSRHYKADASLNTDIGVNDMVNIMTGGVAPQAYDDVEYTEPSPKLKRAAKKPAAKKNIRKKK